MSIIYDALKKAQNINPNFPLNRPELQAQQPPTAPGEKTPPKKPGLGIMGIVIIIILSGYLFMQKTGLFSAGKKTRRGSKENFLQALFKPHKQEKNPKKASSPPPKPAPERTYPSDPMRLVLEGIMLSDDENTALINGQICIVGDIIEGALIEAINKKEVLLSYQGQKITLKNK